MKTLFHMLCLAALAAVFSVSAYCENTYNDRMVTKFSDPNRPGILNVVSGSGNITITGYDGKEVIIETKSTEKDLLNPPENEKTKGMKRLTGSGVTVTSEEEKNAIVITRSMQIEADLTIRVPYKTSLKLGGGNVNQGATRTGGEMTAPGMVTDTIINSVLSAFSALQGALIEGNVIVNNISGEMEINILEGNISLQNVSGEVVTSSVNGEILATFKSINKDKPLAFSTLDGDIDVTLPPDIPATITARNVEGDIYTDFDIATIPAIPLKSVKEEKKWTGSMVIMFGKTVMGKINGGGSEIQMTTMDGNIYIRKGK